MPKTEPENQGDGEIQWVEAGLIKPEGEIKHPVLPVDLVTRIERFVKVFGETYPLSLERTIYNFKREAHPGSEVERWEAMAEVYRDYLVKTEGLSADQKKELLSILLFSASAANRPGGFRYFDKPAILRITKELERAYAVIQSSRT